MSDINTPETNAHFGYLKMIRKECGIPTTEQINSLKKLDDLFLFLEFNKRDVASLNELASLLNDCINNHNKNYKKKIKIFK